MKPNPLAYMTPRALHTTARAVKKRLTIGGEPGQTVGTTTLNGNTAPRKSRGFFVSGIRQLGPLTHNARASTCRFIRIGARSTPGTKAACRTNNRGRFNAVVEPLRHPFGLRFNRHTIGATAMNDQAKPLGNEKPRKAGGPCGASNTNENRPPHYTSPLELVHGFKDYILAEHGLDLLGDLITDGRFHYLGTAQDRKGKKAIRYCVHVDEPPNVYFNDLKRGFHGVWYPKGHEPLDPAERERRRREIEAHRAQREAETQAKHAKRGQWARELWRKSTAADPSHPYLMRKGVGVYGIRYLPIWERRIYQDGGAYESVIVEGVLLVPMKDETGLLWNVQAIFAHECEALERDRDFLPGARVTGLFHWLGERTETVCLAEGYATGASIYEATGYRVFICFSAGNLPPVALAVRAALPDAKLVICADYDKPDKKGRRAGIEKAEEAAALVDGFIALPPIEGADFNDWANELRSHGDDR